MACPSDAWEREALIAPLEISCDMSNRRFHVYVEKDKTTRLFAARCLEMSVFSQGKTRNDALRNIREAIALHLEMIEDELKGKQFVEVEV